MTAPTQISAVCYNEKRVDEKLLSTIKERIEKLHVDALTMNQESLAECLFPYKWYNPFPKFRFSERLTRRLRPFWKAAS